MQDHPARYSPQVGWEGANVIFDTWVHPLVMGLEEHLLNMFRDDFEFNDEAGPSHLAALKKNNEHLPNEHKNEDLNEPVESYWEREDRARQEIDKSMLPEVPAVPHQTEEGSLHRPSSVTLAEAVETSVQKLSALLSVAV